MVATASAALSDLSLHNTLTAPGRAANDNPDQAREVAKQFESLLIRTMLKSMRSATPTDGLLNSEQGDMYLEMFDQKIADEISQRGNFGIQESIYRQLKNQPDVAHIASLSSRLSTPGKINALSPGYPRYQSVDEGPGGFVDKLKHAAQRTADKLGTSIEAVIAVAALETGWGKRVAKTDDGRSTYNLFGIKADPKWIGESQMVQTHEFRVGRLQSEKAAFRVYRNEFESIEDFGSFLLDNPRYKPALEAADNPQMFIRELQRAGYATDPDYADKVISVMQNVTDLMAGSDRKATVTQAAE